MRPVRCSPAIYWKPEYTDAKVGRRVEVFFEKLNDEITLPQFRLAPQ